MKTWIIFLIFLVVGNFALADTADEGATDPDSPSVKKDVGHSIAPIVAYDPTFKVILGAAYFYQGENLFVGVDGSTNFNRVYQGHVNHNLGLTENLRARVYLCAIEGFQPYYGEGGETDPAALSKLWGFRSMDDLSLEYSLSKLVTLSFIGSFRMRLERSSGSGPFVRRFPDEQTIGMGPGLILDSTEDKPSPREGFKFKASVLYFPSLLTTLPGQSDFVLMQGGLNVYKEILQEITRDIVAAFRVAGGISSGTPSYMYRYTLGGTDDLPGYLDNRFRGKKFYFQQTEFRYPIWKIFSGALMLGFGDATDDRFTNPKLSYGAGIRIGLPPDWVSKVRIDFAWGRDEKGIFVDFGQTF
jgi:hypothetical protein